MKIKNILTVDVEDWYQTSVLQIEPYQWSNFEDRVVKNTERLLQLFADHDVRATFFVLGYVAEQHPALVRKIAEQGHEIGSHGYWHQLVSGQTLRQFREDVSSSKKMIEDIVGKEVLFYRAPSWSITNDHFEVLKILQEEGFACDSSLQPFRTPLSGCKGVPAYPYHPVINGEKLDLIEYPPTVYRAGGVNIPFSGGFYLRFWPKWFVKRALRRVNQRMSGMIYIHPWEMDADQPRLHLPVYKRFVQYYHLSGTEKKLTQLLKEFSFIPLGEAIENKRFPAVTIK